MSRHFRLGALLLIWASCVVAQEGPLVDEIIVTAQRVEESAQRVPISLNAFGEAAIDDRRIVGLADLQGFVPNLNYTTNELADPSFNIRGVGSLVAVEFEILTQPFVAIGSRFVALQVNIFVLQ